MSKFSEIARRLVPAVCDVSVTNVCNAACDFCLFARDKQVVRDRFWVDRDRLAEALPILYRRGIRYINFQGGEPLMHRAIDWLVQDAKTAGMQPTLITNGWLLPDKIERLIAAGLSTLIVSIDSHSMTEHERNRGLPGVGERIRQSLAIARKHGVPRLASVTVNRLVRYDALPELLRDLGFSSAVFSYPRWKPLRSSSLSYNEHSRLIDFNSAELVRDLEAIKSLNELFPVWNATASIDDVERYVHDEVQMFPCVGGYKYFYLDWNLDIWRCEAWPKPLGSVFDLDRIKDCRDPCTACMMTCYRNSSTLMHAAVAISDALMVAARGRLAEAARLIFRRSVALSLGAVAGKLRQISRLA